MHCLALSLDSPSNQTLFKLGSYICSQQKTSFLIEKFHLTLICVDEDKNCSDFIKDIRDEKFVFSRITPIKWTVLEGRNTDFDYLAIEVYLPKKILNNINLIRKKYINKSYYDLRPHISVAKGPKGSFSKEFIKHINEKFSLISYFYAKELIHFTNFEIVKKTALKELLAQPEIQIENIEDKAKD